VLSGPCGHGLRCCRYDTDRANGLSQDQFVAMLSRLQHRPEAPRPRSGFRGTATAPWTASTPPRRTAGDGFSAGQVFERYDLNKSGALELDEVRKLFADYRSGKLDLGSWTGPTLGPWGREHGGRPVASPAAAASGTFTPPPWLERPPAFGSGDLLYGSRSGVDGGEEYDLEVAGLVENYHSRMSSMTTVHARLMAKREALLHQLSRIGARREEVASARRAIERETLADSEAVLHRLRSAEALKQSFLAHEGEHLAEDIRAIDAFSQHLAELAPTVGEGEPDTRSSVEPRVALSFMRAYPELCADADRLLARPIKTSIDVDADDFEREVASRAAVLKRHQALLDLLAAKDAIIHLLLREREAAEAKLTSSHAESASELRRWVELAERLASELQVARTDGATGHLSEAASIVDLQARALADATHSALRSGARAHPVASGPPSVAGAEDLRGSDGYDSDAPQVKPLEGSGEEDA
jgi:hypothetical protein